MTGDAACTQKGFGGSAGYRVTGMEETAGGLRRSGFGALGCKRAGRGARQGEKRTRFIQHVAKLAQ